MKRHRSSTPLPYARPRSGDGQLRRGDASGGLPLKGRVRGWRVPVDYSAGPVFANRSVEQGEIRQRGPWWYAGNVIPPAEPLRWTDSGPVRLALHVSTSTWRRWSGGSHQDREGLHTGPPVPINTAGSRKPSQMSRPRQSRLTVQRYRGQTFSQTTEVLGGANG